MAGRMKRDLYAVYMNHFIPFDRLVISRPKAQLQQRQRMVMTKVGLASRPRMITVRMRYHRLINGLPRIDVEFARGTVETFICEFDEQ